MNGNSLKLFYGQRFHEIHPKYFEVKLSSAINSLNGSYKMQKPTTKLNNGQHIACPFLLLIWCFSLLCKILQLLWFSFRLSGDFARPIWCAKRANIIANLNHSHEFFPCKGPFHKRFLSRQLDAIFVALKLYQVSNMFETPAISWRQITLKIAPGLRARFWSCNISATKIASSCCDKKRLCKRALNRTEKKNHLQ